MVSVRFRSNKRTGGNFRSSFSIIMILMLTEALLTDTCPPAVLSSSCTHTWVGLSELMFR